MESLRVSTLTMQKTLAELAILQHNLEQCMKQFYRFTPYAANETAFLEQQKKYLSEAINAIEAMKTKSYAQLVHIGKQIPKFKEAEHETHPPVEIKAESGSVRDDEMEVQNKDDDVSLGNHGNFEESERS